MPVPTATRQGSVQAADVYLSVGLALSWWEASEDILMGLFGLLCADTEPTAFETYVASSRASRGKMMLSALGRYGARFLDDEMIEIRSAIKILDKLAPMRNQIAHGHVSQTKKTSDGVVTMEGHFLVPSLNETGRQVARDFRYAHTALEIDIWRDRVRVERAKIMDADFAAQHREQSAMLAMSDDDQRTISTAKAIASKQVPASAYSIIRRT